MTKVTSLSREQKKEIDDYRRKGLSIRLIAEKVAKPKSTVGAYLALHKKHPGLAHVGRPRLHTERDDRSIRSFASNRAVSCSAIAAALGLKLSRWTINRVIGDCKYLRHEKMITRQFLKPTDYPLRLQWAKDHMAWKVEWDYVIWSDEKKFNLDGPDGYNCYWHDLRKESLIFSRRTFDGGSVMVWCSACKITKLCLYFLEGTLTGGYYVSLLNSKLLPMLPSGVREKYCFQQDGASAHRAVVTKQFLQSSNIRVLPWPARSPDMNPMENVFGWLSKEVYAGGKTYETKEDLKIGIRSAWDRLTPELMSKFAGNLPERIFDLIKANGHQTRF